MGKIYTIIVTLLFSVGSLHAQAGSRSMRADGIKMVRTGENLTVAFTLNAGKKATKAAYDLVVDPVLLNGASKRTLPPIVIRGRRSKVLAARYELAAGERTYQQNPLYMAAGESLDYTATLPYESWMSGGQLALEGVSVGCCSSEEVQLGLIADNILYAEPHIETRIVEVPTTIPLTTGEQLSGQYPFVAPASEFELIRQVLQRGSTFDNGRNELSRRVIAETRQGSISIYFGQGVRAVDRNFGENNSNLVELIAAVRALAAAEDTQVAAIVIAGFTSPEGSPELNDRLAWDRAVAVKEFLTQNSDVDPRTIRIFNGGADWGGLKELVENSRLNQKQRIIDIIDNEPVWDPYLKTGRLGELMRLDGGEPYSYMLTNFFPRLRQAAYIKVYYEDK